MHYLILKLIFNWEYQQASLQTCLELPKTPGGHPKKISPYDLHYSTHVLDLKESLQQSVWK